LKRALLFDLDETLVVEEPAAVAAFEATARVAAAQQEVDVATLAVAARSQARELWYAVTPVRRIATSARFAHGAGVWVVRSAVRFGRAGRRLLASREGSAVAVTGSGRPWRNIPQACRPIAAIALRQSP
jgi:phosphoglycolate phosphatase-like HAD superfamily hydrolase